MHIEEFVRRLEGVKRRGESYESKCPAHDDRKASLSVGVGRDGGIVVHCHAGCFAEDVLEAMALSFRDVAPEERNGNTNGAHPPQTVYRYDDEDGNALFEVVKTANKDFWQRRPGQRKGSMGDVRRVLYRLPDLLNTEPNQIVFIAEGEKDADNLWRLGFAATTSAMGAGKWRQDYTDWLRGRLPDRWYIVLPDNDIPGFKHADEVVQSLRNAGLTCEPLTLPDLPPSGDVSDWIGKGGTAEELLGHVAALGNTTPVVRGIAKPRGPQGFKASEVMVMEMRDPKWAVEGYISEGLNILAGGQKLGKSWLALDLTIAVASGGLALGSIEVDAGDALYLALEDTLRRLKGRLEMLLRGAPAPERLELFTEWPRIGEGGEEWLQQWLTAHPSARLVVIDTLKKIRPGRGKNGNAYDEDYEFMGKIKAIADEFQVAILVLHHVRKMKADDPFDLVSGTMGLTGAADATMVMQRVRGKTDATLHITGRDIEEREELLNWDRETGVWTMIGDAEEYRRSEQRRDLLRVMAERGGPMSPKDVYEVMGGNRSSIRSLMARMANRGDIQITSPGKYEIVIKQ